MIVAWFSCGATSAVACKLALEQYDDVHLVYIDTKAHHPDNMRFLHECEEWLNTKVEIIQPRYEGHFDVFRKLKFINSPSGASCTYRLKKMTREKFESEHPEITHYVWGFEKGSHEELRASRIQERVPEYKHLFPLIENKLNKADCLHIIKEAGIEIPEMYRLGYHNNNCVGCVKGGMGYWNKIRVDFPETFNEMAKIEREINHSAIRGVFLDELDPERGKKEGPIVPSCSIFCEFVNTGEYGSTEDKD